MGFKKAEKKKKRTLFGGTSKNYRSRIDKRDEIDDEDDDGSPRASGATRTLDIVRTVFTWVIVALAVFMMIFTIVSVNTFDRNDRSLFGYKFFIVQTDSMSATDFDAGDVVVSKEVDNLSALREGDIITFVSQNSQNFGETVTHKIRKVTTDSNGNRAFVTYGTTTNTDDETLVLDAYVVGQYQFRVPNVGAFFLFLKTTPGYILCILIPFLLIILSQGVDCIRLFRKYKGEQMDALEAEREKIEAEREESRRMMEELLALKAQLAKSEAAPGAEPAPAEPAEEKSSENIKA